MQFLPRQSNPIGEAIGGTLRDALDYLTHKKLLDLRYKQNENALQALGYSAEKASQIAPVAGPDIFKEIFRSGEIPGGASSSTSGESEFDRALDLIGGRGAAREVEKPIRQYQEQQRHIAPEQQAAAQRSNARQIIEQYTSKKNPEIEKEAKKEKELELKQEKAIEKQEKAAEKQVKVAEKEAQILPKVIQEAANQPSNIKTAQTAEQVLQNAQAPDSALKSTPVAAEKELTAAEMRKQIDFSKLTTKQKNFVLEQLHRKQQQENTDREFEERAFKETREERLKILEEGNAAKGTIRDLDRMEQLNREGNLDTPGYIEMLKRSGLDIPALMNPESEEFLKIAQNFLKDAKVYYGGKVSNYEVEQFLKTIPSLSQSPEGRKRVIAGLKNIANAKKAYADTYLEIYKENGGKPPIDMNEQIYERVDKKLDKLSEKFLEDISKPVPAGQNKFITALQSSLGSLLGAPGSLIGAAGHAIAPAAAAAL